MTGPEQYREAERLADRAHHYTYGDGADPVTGAAFAAEATARAILALTAATIEMADNAANAAGINSPALKEWWAAIEGPQANQAGAGDGD